MKRTFVAALLAWRIAPPTVKWTSALLAVIILCNLDQSLSGIRFFIAGLPDEKEKVRPYILAIILAQALTIVVLSVFLAATIGLLRRQPWARIVLELFAWLGLVASCGVALHLFKRTLHFGDIFYLIIPVIIELIVIFTLRARTTRQWCSTKAGEPSNTLEGKVS